MHSVLETLRDYREVADPQAAMVAFVAAGAAQGFDPARPPTDAQFRAIVRPLTVMYGQFVRLCSQ